MGSNILKCVPGGQACLRWGGIRLTLPTPTPTPTRPLMLFSHQSTSPPQSLNSRLVNVTLKPSVRTARLLENMLGELPPAAPLVPRSV